MTLREEVWDEALTKLKTDGEFRISELDALDGDESKRATARRALRQMEDKGWVSRTSEQSPIWRIGWKAKVFFGDEAEVDAEDVEH